MKDLKVKYKWQQDIINEEREMPFDDLVEELASVAGLGDFMDGRDQWQMEYYIKRLKERYKTSFEPFPTSLIPTLTYKCPKCSKFGFPSIYSDENGEGQCTDCSNRQRGFY